VFLVFVPLLIAQPQPILIGIVGFITAVYIAMGAYKAVLLVRSDLAARGPEAHSSRSRADRLPPYTILVPLHREGRILPALVSRLTKIDYPTDRLQILLLIEMDDEETQRAIDEYPLPYHIRPMTMPPGQPRTKPRALNIGLREAEGDYVVIYDAEDEPEPDQLRKAVAAFGALPRDVVCLQARLNFYNGRRSILTRLFAVDYALWYEQMLPGLAFSGARGSGKFVPLGGTSNHFRVESLRQLGGWDPFNVTEDCDLGLRLGRQGWRVAMLDSMTWEEAVRQVGPWVTQRSRWFKGYLQTYLVHMRDPIRLWKELGRRGFTDFQMLVGASSLVLLLNPVMWLLTALYLATRGSPMGAFIETLFPAPIYYPALVSLTIGNFVLFYVNAYVCVRHNLLDMTRYTLLTPVYWVLMSLGAWAGVISLIRNPFYWAKTEHGDNQPGPGDAPYEASLGLSD